MLRRGFVPGSLLVTLLCLAAAQASAQAMDWLAGMDGITIPHDPGSSRLDGMGGLSITIPDEGNRLDLYRYGGNLASILDDSDRRKWDFWTASQHQNHDAYDATGLRTRMETSFVESGARMSWRGGKDRVLGLEYTQDALTDRVERGDDSKIHGPWWGGFAAQRIGGVILGGGARLTSDNQDLYTSDVFGIAHSSSGLRLTGSLATTRGPFDLGLQLERQIDNIDGVSRDEARFHEDQFTWKRPIGIYGGTLIWKPSETVRGALRAQLQNTDGREDVRVSWSNRMPQNPGRQNFVLRTGTFEETVRNRLVNTRWEIQAFPEVRLGAEGEYGHVTDDVVEGDNFKGSQRALNETDHWYRAGAGASYEVPSRRLRLGVEGWYYRLVQDQTLVDGTLQVVPRTLELRAGAEYFVDDEFAVRGGYIRSNEDADRNTPRNLGVGNGFTLGAGWFPRGGLYEIDAALKVQNVNPNYTGYPDVKDSRLSFSLGARLLL